MNTEKTPNISTDGKDAPSSDANLIKLDDSKSGGGANDINSKITALDTDLAQLRAELGSINSSVEEGLDRLSDTDTDLTAKVSETYKRLGEIDNAYKSLMAISTRIDTDIQKLNGDVSTVAEQSANGIKNLEKSTMAQSNDFAQKNQQVVSRVNQLVETSKLTSEMLNQKIQSTTENILNIEKNVVAEIQNLSDATDDKTDAIERNIEQSRAQILKLQSVDEAIIKRATTLEISAAELGVKSQTLEASTDQLFASAELLSSELDELKELTAKQGGMIGGLQTVTSELGEKLGLLSSRESKHFTIVSLGFLLLIIAVAVIYLSQQDQFSVTDDRIMAQGEKVESQIVNLQQVQADDKVSTDGSLVALGDKVDTVSSDLKQALASEMARVEEKVVALRDQVHSVEGRFNNASPFSQIGNDNIIHGERWIAGLPADNYSIQLAYVDDKAKLFEIAERYNNDLDDSLSYFTVKKAGVSHYVLLSGNYSTEDIARRKLAGLPHYIEMQKPVIRELSQVQQYLAE